MKNKILNLFKLKDILYYNNNYKAVSGIITIYNTTNSTEIFKTLFLEESGLKQEIEDIYKDYKININELLFQYTSRLSIEEFENNIDIILLLETGVYKNYYIKIKINLKNKKEEKKTEQKERKIEKEDKIKCPDHYKLNVSGVENGVNDVIKAIKKKIEDNNIEVDKLEFHWYCAAVEYLLRAYFKGQKESDLKKVITEIQFILDNKHL